MADPKWEDTTEVPNTTTTSSTSKPRTAQALLEGYGQGATLGYLPHIQAATAPATYGVLEKIASTNLGAKLLGVPQGAKVDAGTYLERRDENLTRHEALAKDNPGAYMTGQGLGILATSIVPGRAVAQGVKSAGTLASVAKGAAVGATEAALMNPGDTIGEFNPLQIKERLDNARVGAMFGSGGAAFSKATSVGVSKAKDLAEKFAFKSSGAMLKDFRKAAGNDKINDLGRFLLNKVIKVGDTFEDIAAKTGAIKNEVGKEIGRIYRSVLDDIGKSEFWQKLDPAKKSALALTGFKPRAHAEEIISTIDEALGHSPNKKAAISFINEYIGELAQKYGDDLDIVTANAIKGDIDKAINYGKRIQDLPEKQEALFALRNFIRDRIDDHISVLDDIVGGDKLKKLKEANKVFGAASELEGIAFDRVQRESANRFFSLGDRLTGGAVTAGGAVSGAILGGDAESAVKGAALGLGGALLSRGARRFGATGAAKTLDAASRMSGAATVPAAVASSVSRAAGSPEVKENVPKFEDTEDIFLAEKSQNVAEVKPQKGPEKWANDGFEKVLKHTKDQAKIERYKELKDKLLKDRKTKALFIQASDLPPGSKAMDNLLKRIDALEKKEK